MASLKELKATLPAYYTLSNKKLLVIARVREESVYFYDQLAPTTTVILLAEPACYALKRIFLEIINDIGATVIDIREKETFDPSYEMSQRSKKIITTLLHNESYDQIITHPRYSRENDPQNRAIFDLISANVKDLGTNNHYTYNKIGQYGTPQLPCKVKMGIFEIYCALITENNEIDDSVLQNYIDISSNISGIRKITNGDQVSSKC